MSTGIRLSARGLTRRPALAITVLLAVLVATIPLVAGSADATAATSASSSLQAATIPTDPDLRIAIIGDSGVRSESKQVLELIDSQDVDMVLHIGDFDYRNDPARFESVLDRYLGADMPIFAVVGNHDLDEWPTYQQNFIDRLDATAGATCSGEYGVNASCSYRGLSFILSGIGTLGSGHQTFLDTELSSDDHLWRLCMFHKNQREMQIGNKGNAVGWDAYETCRENGAIILNAHEHSYSRTKTLVDMSQQTIDPAWPLADDLRVGPGSTFTIVQGLAGQPIRPQVRCLPASPPYGCDGEWASILSTTNGTAHGALFLDLGIEGDPARGRGTFIDINGQVLDSFDITSENGTVASSPTEYYSIAGSTTLPDGTKIANDDIVAVGPNGPSLYLDGSDIGIGPLRIGAFSILDDGDIVMSFTVAGTVPGIGGTVDDSDLVRFSPSTLGSATSGSFSMYFDGSDVGLTTSGEDIDAVHVFADGTIAMSTVGTTSVPGVTPRDEDLLLFTPTSLGDDTTGTWADYFDGSDAGVGPEDVDGASVSGDLVSLSFKNAWTVGAMVGADEDIVDFLVTDLGPPTMGSFVAPQRFDGSEAGVGGTDIDGIHVP